MGHVDEREVHEFFAREKGYFWLPCPFPGCGRMFGGHECGDYSIRDKDNPRLSSMTCHLHDEFAKEAFDAMCWKEGITIERWSSDERFHHVGDPVEDMKRVSEFRQRESGDD